MELFIGFLIFGLIVGSLSGTSMPKPPKDIKHVKTCRVDTFHKHCEWKKVK